MRALLNITYMAGDANLPRVMELRLGHVYTSL